MIEARCLRPERPYGKTDTSGTMQRDYIFFDGRRIAWRDGTGVHYYFVDAIGSTRVATDATGSTCGVYPDRSVGEADYYPYGQENARCASRMALRDDYNTSCSPTYKFAGYEFDSETGNYYDNARYYSPSLGRFLTADPSGSAIGNPQSQNGYTYVVNNPESFVDPLGLYYWACMNEGSPNASGTGFGGFDGPADCFEAPNYTQLLMVAYGVPEMLLEGDTTSGDSYIDAGDGGYGNTLGVTPGLYYDGYYQWYPDGTPPPTTPTTPTTPGTSGSGGGWTQAQSYAHCVADSGNEGSLQGLLGLSNSKIAGAFLGNPISDLINLATGSGSAGALGGDAVSLVAPSALKTVPNVSFSYTSATVTATPSEFSVVVSHIEGLIPLGEIAKGAAKGMEGFAYAVQFPVDITAIGFGAITCSVPYD